MMGRFLQSGQFLSILNTSCILSQRRRRSLQAAGTHVPDAPRPRG